MANEILTEIRLQLDTFRADLKAAQDAANTTAKASGQAVGDGIEKGLNKAAGALKAQIIAIGAAVAGAFTVGKAVEQAAEQEAAVHALNAALALNGQYTEAASAHFLTYAESLSKATTASNDAIVSGGATLAQFGKLSGESLDRATKAALDFAATGRVSLEQAFQLIGKAADGNVASLARYGVRVRSTGDDVQDFAAALNILENRFGGLAQLQTNTFDGAMKQTHNAFNEVLESVGNLIVKSPTVIRLLHVIRDAFLAGAEAITKWAKGRDVMNEMLILLAELGQAANKYLVLPFELAFNILRLGFESIKFLIQGVIYGMAVGFEKITGMLAPFSSKMAEVNAGLKTFVQDAGTTLDEFGAKSQEANNKLFEFNVAAKTEEYITQVTEWAEAVKPVVATKFGEISQSAMDAQKPILLSGWEFMVNGFNAAFGKVALTSDKFRADLQTRLNGAFTSFRDGVANSFASIGAALVKGENAFAAFGKAILGVFGDLAIQIGMFYFLMGLANLFVNPPAAAAEIAGGLALIVLGGALKAIAGGGGGGVGGAAPAGVGAGGEGGGVAQNPNLATQAPDSFNDTQRGEGSKVIVNVQGNVLDRRQTGLELADAINEAFGSNGVTFATGGNGS